MVSLVALNEGALSDRKAVGWGKRRVLRNCDMVLFSRAESVV